MTRAAPALLALLSALPTAAAEPEVCRTVALHPVVVNGADPVADKEMIAEIQAVVASELLKRQRTLQDSSIIAEALSQVPNQLCTDNDCLAKLARDSSSDCTAYFAVTPNAGRHLFLSARLIRSSGGDRPVFSRTEHYDRIGKTPRDWSISALQRFIRSVPLADAAAVEPSPLVPNDNGNPPGGQSAPDLNPPPQVPPSPATPAPPPGATTPPEDLAWRTPVGIGAAAAGAAAVITGIVVYEQARTGWDSFVQTAKTQGNYPFPPDQTETVLSTYRSARGNMQLGSAAIIGGATLAAAGAGLLLWQFLGTPAEKTPGTKVACGLTTSAVQCSIPLP